MFAKKFKSYAKINDQDQVLRDAKMCSTSERYSKNIGAQRSPINRFYDLPDPTDGIPCAVQT